MSIVHWDLHKINSKVRHCLLISQATSFADMACEANRSLGRTATCWKKTWKLQWLSISTSSYDALSPDGVVVYFLHVIYSFPEPAV